MAPKEHIGNFTGCHTWSFSAFFFRLRYSSDTVYTLIYHILSRNSMDWFKGKSTGNHRFSHWIWGFPVNFPLNQSIEKPQSQDAYLLLEFGWSITELSRPKWSMATSQSIWVRVLSRRFGYGLRGSYQATPDGVLTPICLWAPSQSDQEKFGFKSSWYLWK
jgi:hypothetical protein